MKYIILINDSKAIDESLNAFGITILMLMGLKLSMSYDSGNTVMMKNHHMASCSPWSGVFLP